MYKLMNSSSRKTKNFSESDVYDDGFYELVLQIHQSVRKISIYIIWFSGEDLGHPYIIMQQYRHH